MDYDVIIIGAGVIGLAVAKELAEKTDKTVLVVEKESNFGQGISSRNSEVIHSGVYYPNNSLKANYCLRGRELLYDFCRQYSLWVNKCGKLVIGRMNQQDEIERLYEQGTKNGVQGLKIIERSTIEKLEPHVTGDLALFVGCTGIVSAHEFMSILFNISNKKDHDYLYHTKVINTYQVEGGYELVLRNPQHIKETVTTEWVVNSAGLYSDVIAKMILDHEDLPQLRYSKGCYYSLSSKWRGLFNHLVYPVPNQEHVSLGIHLSFNESKTVKLGPSAHWMNDHVEDYTVDESLIQLFHREATQYIKGLKMEDLSPDYAGIRPKIYNEKNLLSDFYISHEAEKGLPRWINLIGIESPGLTSALAIGEDVVEKIVDYDL